MNLRNRLLLSLRLLWLTLIALWGMSLAPAQAETGEAASAGSLSVLEEAPASAQVVHVGFYVNTVYQLEVASSTYYLDAYMWFRWQGDIDPTATMEITNNVEEWGSMITPLSEAPTVLPDGSNYMLFKIEGRFMQPFELSDYPLDRQRLSIYIEDNTHGIDALVYVMDEQDSGYGHMLAIPGWSVTRWASQAYSHDYGSFFGAEKAGSASVYATLRFDLEIARPVNFFVWKLMLPLIIILVASWMVLVIEPQIIDVRTGLPGTGLLTAVFLQQSYSDGLPEVGYLVLIDKIYAVAYAMIIITLLRAIWTSRTVHIPPEVVAVTRRFDQRLLVAQVLIFAVAVAAIVTFR
jgi:hypothetical protein